MYFLQCLALFWYSSAFHVPTLASVSPCVVSKSGSSHLLSQGGRVLEASGLDRHLGDLSFGPDSAIIFPWELGPITKTLYTSVF